MNRKIMKELELWKEDYKKPLMLIGARQTGKTYILEEFCKNYFEHYVYINLEKESNISDIFNQTIDPDEIIESIKVLKNINFDVENTILFLLSFIENIVCSSKYGATAFAISFGIINRTTPHPALIADALKLASLTAPEYSSEPPIIPT